MDIYSYINSEAIANHCRKINHVFSPLDTAYLIYASQSHTLPEKYAAWNELIETMPDMEIKERRCTPHFDSLHEFLQLYMRIQSKYIDIFYQDEPGCVYYYEVLYTRDRSYSEDGRFFTRFKPCYKALITEIDDLVESFKKSDIDIAPIDIRVTKQWINQDDDENPRRMKVCINYKGIPMDIWEDCTVISGDDSAILSAFDGLWPEIPTPFQKGDILVEKRKIKSEKSPFVLDKIMYWEDDEDFLEFMREDGDSTDLITTIYGQDQDGAIWHDHGPSYLDLEYCDRKLEGAERILIAVSNHLKGTLDLEFLVRAYDILKCEAHIKEERYLLSGFIDEVHIKAGLKDESDAEEPH